MQLERLDITRPGYPTDAPLEGTVKFKHLDEDGKKSEISFQLTEESTQGIINLCAAAIAETGRDYANQLTTSAVLPQRTHDEGSDESDDD